jgi:tRNA(Ile)-lysidine synthase
MSVETQPIRAGELEGLFGPYGDRFAQACALAVSGGSDSTALMVLFADWLRQRGAVAGVHTVLTVDHGLRPVSAAEARAVADRAATLGFQHAILAWEGAKPRTGIQAAARAVRYGLMCEYMRAHDLPTLLTAHTLDDQAETLLMRLARGSGLDGLAAMAPWTETGPPGTTGPLSILRPLLGVAKARLRATLEARRIPWTEDPSNQSPAFERTRWRAARGNLETLGLSSAMLASSARRLQRARAALEAVTDAYCAEERGLVRTDRRYGVFCIDREQLCRAPEEIALRVIGRCIAAAGGSGEPVPLGRLEPVVARLRRCNGGQAGIIPGDADGRWTLARAQITAAGQVVQVEREPGRLPLPVLALAGGSRALWDGRFAVEIADGFGGSLEVRALGSAGLAELKRLGRAVKATSALLLAPSFWRGTELLAVPAIDFWAREGLEGTIAALFEGVRYNSGPGARPCGDDLDPQ